MTRNHQQYRCGSETCGHRCDPVDETSNDLRTPGLKRRIPWRATSAAVITGMGPSNIAAPCILAICANSLVVGPGHTVVTVTPVPRNSWPIARPNDNQQRDILRKCLRNARQSVLNAATCLGGKHNIPPPYSVEELGACRVKRSGRLLEAGVVFVPFLLELVRHLLKMLDRDPRSPTLSAIVFLGF